MTTRADAVAVAKRFLPKHAGGHTKNTGRGWLSDAGAYAPIGTPELDLCETPRGRGRRERNRDKSKDAAAAAAGAGSPAGGGGGADSQWLPMIHDPSDRVVDYNAAAFSHLRREIRRSSRAIPACKAGQDLQEVMTNPMLHTQPLSAATAREAQRSRTKGKYGGGHGGGGHGGGGGATAGHHRGAGI